MSDEILGHDVNGEALRAGDRVMIFNARREPKFEGHETEVVGVADDGDIKIAETNALGWHYEGNPRCMRKVSPGRDVFEKARDRALTEGNPDAQRSEPTTTERAQAWISGQPWTEPSR